MIEFSGQHTYGKECDSIQRRGVILQFQCGSLALLTVTRAGACAFCVCIIGLLNRLLIGDAGRPNCVAKKAAINFSHMWPYTLA